MSGEGYGNPKSFKDALEAHVRAEAKRQGVPVERQRQRLVFERFLSRLVLEHPNTFVLKGGLALELRLGLARTTRDIDLRMSGSPDGLLETLQRCGRLEQPDFMQFEVEVNKAHPTINAPGNPYDGFRFRGRCSLANKPYGDPFDIDVVIAGAMFGDPTALETMPLPRKMGVTTSRILVLPIETHLAEKLHAYSATYPSPNSRTKDLPDIALIGRLGHLIESDVRTALNMTFDFRNTHAIPERFAKPPEAWRAPYATMAEDNDLPWKDLDAVASAAREFLEPILGPDSGSNRRWNPVIWKWE